MSKSKWITTKDGKRIKIQIYWVSVKDRLPEIPKSDEGYDCFLVTDGDLIHMAYYTEDGWLFADSGEMKKCFMKLHIGCHFQNYHQRSDADG